MDVVVVLIAVWFVIRRFEFDTRTLCARVLAWIADSTASIAERFDQRFPEAAAKTCHYARATAGRLRSRPAPTAPRTASGQDLLAGLGGVTAAGVAVIIIWVRVLAADATAAATAAKERHQATGDPWWRNWREWGRWPAANEPGAPVKATAERIPREALDPPPPEPQPEPAPSHESEHTPGGTMTNPHAIDPGPADGPAAGEGGLGSYIQFTELMAAGCGQGISITETTIGDMVGNGWEGPRVDPLRHAMEQLGAAQQAFVDAHAALTGSLGVADAYSANPGTGNKESVTNL